MNELQIFKNPEFGEIRTVAGLCRDTLLLDKTFPAKRPGGKKNGRIVVPLVALARWMSI